jgi:aryl-alcohol dehydrogenase-like predicted oxidoreductase
MSYSLTRREALAGIGAIGLTAGSGIAPASAQAKPELLTKPIPSTGERLPVIGIGTARRYDVGTDEKERGPIREVLQNLPKLGGKLVDTAPSYGTAEQVIGDILTELKNRDQIFLATKVGDGNRGVAAGIREMEESLKKLRTSKLDLLMVHNLNGVTEMLPVLREWKEKGRTRYIGMSTSFDRQYDDFAAIIAKEKLDFIQVDYAIDNRDAEKRILPLAADRGMAVLTNLPFGRGRVFQAFGKKPIPDWAKELGIETWAQFALKFLVSHPAVTVAIPGTARPDYLADNIGAARLPMPDAKTRERMADLIANG